MLSLNYDLISTTTANIISFIRPSDKKRVVKKGDIGVVDFKNHFS